MYDGDALRPGFLMRADQVERRRVYQYDRRDQIHEAQVTSMANMTLQASRCMSMSA